MYVKTFEETRVHEVQLPGARVIHHDYFGIPGVLAEGLHAYTVGLPDPDSIIPPHFHDVDQFQLVIEGRGRCGKQAWKPGAFYYSDAYASYGPIVASDGGLVIFTLRAAAASGQYEMPQSRHLIPGPAGKAKLGQFDIERSLPSEGVTQFELASRPDGVLVLGLQCAPGASLDNLPEPSSGGGQYIVVVNGSLIMEDRALPPFAVMFVSAGEDMPTFHAGPDGANIALFQFAKPSNRHGSDPTKLATRRVAEYAISGRG